MYGIVQLSGVSKVNNCATRTKINPKKKIRVRMGIDFLLCVLCRRIEHGLSIRCIAINHSDLSAVLHLQSKPCSIHDKACKKQNLFPNFRREYAKFWATKRWVFFCRTIS